MKTSPRALASLAVLGLVLCPSPEARAGSPVKQAQKLLDKKIDQAEDDLDDCYDHAFDTFLQSLKEIDEASKQAKLSELEAVEALNAAAATYATDLDSHANFVLSDVCATATSLAAELGSFPTGFLVNDCGAFDAFLATVDKEHAKFGKKALKKLKALLKKLMERAAENGVQIEVNVHVFVLVPPAPAPGPVAPPPPPLKFKSVSSAHDASLTNDGKLSVRGQGPANGTVTVNIQGPNGTNVTKMVPTDADGCFQVGFPATPGDGLPGNLPEGNYKITLTSGDQTVSKFHGV